MPNKMAASGDNSYLITGKVCPPKLPMHNIASDGWNTLTPSILESLFTEVSVQGKQTNSLTSLCALSFQANVWLSTDGLSASSVVGLPYYFCNFCDYHTDSRAQLLRHVTCRHVFKCKLCDFNSVTRYKLVQHQLHKHLDAEEMPPVLSSKMIYLNLSVLQRSLQSISQCDNNSDNSTSSGSRHDESELVNSSQINISKVLEDVMSQELNDRSKDNRARDESQITPSKHRMPNTGPDIAENSDSLSGPDWNVLAGSIETDSLSKRCYSRVDGSDCELSPKRFRKICDEHSAKFDNVYVSSQMHSCQMPHFLDESDSNVTSSCSPPKNTSAVLFEGSKTEQRNQTKNQSRAFDTNPATSRVLSFLTEPTSSSASAESTKSHTRSEDSFVSQFGTWQKVPYWYNDQCDANILKEAHLCLSDASQKLPGNRSGNSSTFFRASRDVEFHARERSQHPDISLLSRERLEIHQDKSTPKGTDVSFSESYRDVLEVAQHGSHIPQSRQCSSTKTSEQSVYGVSSKKAVADRNSARRRSGSQHVNAQDVENFLMTPGNSGGTAGVKRRDDNSELIQSENDSKDYESRSCVRSTVTHSVDDGERYNLLRKLLIGTAGIKKHTDSTTANIEADEQQSGASVSKDLPSSDFSQTSQETYEFRSRAPSVTRASDMSLKDLLTQGLGNISPSVVCACHYCNFSSSSKVELQKHIEKCKYKHGCERTKAHNHVLGLSGQIISEPGCGNNKVSVVKIEPPAAVGKLVDCVHSSEKLMASEVLKGLSEHYPESQSSDSSFQNKCHMQESDLPISEAYSMFKCQADGFDKEVDSFHDLENVNGRHLGHRSARKNKLDLDYSYEPSDNSDSCSSDSDYKSYLNGNVKKKRRQKNQQGFVLKKSCGSDRAAVPQCLDQDLLPKRQPEIHHSCLYCDFTSSDSTNMHQHLTGCHPDSAPFAEALIQPKGKTLLYFCKGVQSRCTYFSSEGAEIFEHIKLCYYGYLDNFISSDSETSPDYSQVLFCLGEASRFIDKSAVMFYCLRCRFSRPNFQQIAGHVSNNHAGYVAGVLSVNRAFHEPRVRMVCLSCSAYIHVKQWAAHSCRKHSRNELGRGAVADFSSELPSIPKLETSLRLPSTPDCQVLGVVHENGHDTYSLHSDSKKYAYDPEEYYKPEMLRLDNGSADFAENQAHDSYTGSQISSKPFSGNNLAEAVNIKREIPDVNFTEEEFVDDIPVHFTHQQEAEADPSRVDKFQMKDNDTEHIRIDQFKITNSPHTCSRARSSGSSVLQSLLTAPVDADLIPKGFGLVQNFIKPSLKIKEKRQPNSLPVFQSLNSLPVFLAESCAVSANTHTQYPCILSMLSRQDCPTEENFVADNGSVPPRADRLPKDKDVDHATDQPTSALTTAICSSQVSSQQSWHTAAAKCSLNHSISVSCQPSSVSAQALSPNLIPHPPPLPLLPPLSPSPPLPPAASLMTAETQDAPGPFTNLLRLLSKSKLNS